MSESSLRIETAAPAGGCQTDSPVDSAGNITECLGQQSPASQVSQPEGQLAMVAPLRVALDPRAIQVRINRKLVAKNQELKKCRQDAAAHRVLGDWFVAQRGPNPGVVQTNVDLESFARELGALEEYETVAGSSAALIA